MTQRTAHYNPVRLLILEDEPDIAEIIRDLAAELGYCATACGSFDEFKDELRNNCPSLIILDLGIPNVDRLEVLDFLVKSGFSAEIIFISGAGADRLNTARDQARARGLDVLSTLAKPFEIGELENLLLKAMQPLPRNEAIQ